uniref:hypothetical protein n=1 Tax=Alistipes sp. TaxID=1872444 RepID=UPI004056D8B4
MIAAQIQNIIEKNEEHKKSLFSKYNPETGEGSPIPRRRLYINKSGNYILIPNYLAEVSNIKDILNAGSIEEFAHQNNINLSDLCEAITRLRMKFDFEYWASTCATILNKETGRKVLFRLRKAQRKLLKVLVTSLFENKPIRVILLKARQWGGSTLVQMFMAWIQLFHRKNWNSVIAAHQDDAARNIRAMYTLMANRHPEHIMKVRLRSFEGSTNNKQIVGRGNVIYTGAMTHPNSLHSGNYKLVHCSEVGLWKETKERKPADFVNAFAGSVPALPYTMIVLESTAKGTGNYFHRTWQAAERGENVYEPVFVAWWEIDMYSMPFESENERYQFVSSMTKDEMYRFELGATLEGLKWYRWKRGEFDNDWSMMEAYPSTAEEAFISSGHKAHHPLYIQQMRRFVKRPKWIGEIYADSRSGENAIDHSLCFHEQENGEFYVWAKPDLTVKYSNRYQVSLDIGGSSAGADWSVIRVLDRLPMLKGGSPEFIATYRFHMDQDLTAWRAVQVAKWYCDALLIVERNSLRSKGQEGNHTITVLDEIKKVFHNLYFRDDPDKVKEGIPERLGFFTGKNKELIVDAMNSGLREYGFIERDERCLNECGYYEIKQDGTYGAVDGEHDDIYMSTGINYYVSCNRPLPKLIEGKKPAPTGESGPKLRGISDF